MSSGLKVLHLNVESVYFEQVKNGSKLHEYREVNEYWKSRLLEKDGSAKSFDRIAYKLGYPRKGDTDREMTFKWLGFEIIPNFVHPKFNNKPVTVFAINLTERSAK